MTTSHHATSLQRILDADGIAIEAGQLVELHMHVRHGLMETVRGVVSHVWDAPAAVTLTLEASRNRRLPSGALELQAAGSSAYFTLPGQYEGGSFVCRLRSDDVDHAHEAWARVVGGDSSDTLSFPLPLRA